MARVTALTISGARLSHRLRAGLTWWRDQLSASLPVALRRLFGDSAGGVCVRATGDDLTAAGPDGATVALCPDGGRICPEAWQSIGTPDQVDLILAADHVLRTELTLPASAEVHLRPILANRLRAETPFDADQVYWDAAIVDRTDQGLKVSLAVAPVETTDPVLDRIERAGARVKRIGVADDPRALNLMPVERRLSAAKPRRVQAARALVAANLLAWAAVGGALLWQQAATVAALEAHQADVQAQARRALALRQEVTALEERASFLPQLRAQSGSVMTALDDLARVVGDDAWLDRAVIEADALEVGGYARSAAGVLEAIDQADAFADASYRAPVRRQDGAEIERFSIAAGRTSTAIEEDAP